MFFASFVRRLVRGSGNGRPAPAGFVPELTLLEGRALPSGNPGLANILPPGAAALVSEPATTSVAFKLTGGGPAPRGLPLDPLSTDNTAPHQATGTATYLGKYTGAGTFTLGSLTIAADGKVTGTFQGEFVFVAANGDRLATTYGDGFSGVFTGVTDGVTVRDITFDAIFTVDTANSTGRFANATGSWRMIANAESVSLGGGEPGFTAPFNYTWTGDGTLHFPKGKK